MRIIMKNLKIIFRQLTEEMSGFSALANATFDGCAF